MIEGIYVSPHTYIGRDKPPPPTPEDAGLKKGHSYKVMHVSDYCPECEAYFLVMNEKKQVWFVSTRYFTVDTEKTFTKLIYKGEKIKDARD